MAKYEKNLLLLQKIFKEVTSNGKEKTKAGPPGKILLGGSRHKKHISKRHIQWHLRYCTVPVCHLPDDSFYQLFHYW